MKNLASRSKCFSIVASIFAMALYFCGLPVQAVNVLTQHNDTSRTGANTNETVLTTANVNSSTFGPKFTNSVDGQVYAQVLYVQNLAISSGTHNVIFVSSENNTVYAFDADSGATYWTNHLVGSLSSGCPDTSPLVGITGTPVIDLSLSALYVDTRLGSTAGHQLHAVNITNGNEMFGGPVNVTNTGFGTSEHQRPGLLEANGVIYVAYGSQCDGGSYHGYVIGFNPTNLAQLYSFNTTPNGSQAAIWSSGMGPVADSSGNIYVITANGSYDGSTNNDYGMSMVKLSSHLAVLDWATPSDYATLSGNDQDFGSGGAVLLPGGRIIGEGKDGIVHVATTSSMGHLNGFAQSFAGPNGGDVCGPSPVYWAGSGTNFIYYEHGNTSTYWYSDNGTTVNTTPLGSNSVTEDDRGGGISLSANGTTNGILWSLDTDGTVRAYDAQHFPTLLWSASVGAWQRQNCPTIANGKVYVPTPSGVIVYGLNNSAPAITSQPSSETRNTNQTATFTVGASGTAPLSYQWKVDVNGSYVNLSNVGQFSGATSATLTISNLVLTNATNYEVVVTNSLGSVTSSAATLTVSTNSSSYRSVVLGDGPLAFWPLNETTGTTIHDVAGTNNGTAINTNNLGYAGPGVTYTNNSSDTAMYFTNTGSPYISVPYNAAFQTTSFSAELWLNMPTFPANAGSANENPVGFCDGLSALGWTFDIQVANASNPHMYGWVGKSGSWNTGDSGVALQSQWSYYVMTFDGSTLKVYTNGVQAASTSVTTYSMVNSGNYLFIGDYNDGGNSPDSARYYEGGIENVAVYSNVLTVAQITNHYYAGTNFSSSSGSAPSITTQPSSTTNYTTQTATFSVTASGTAPLSYQWKVDVNGSYVNLSNVGQFSGATSSTLSISSLVLTNATNYEVVVTNSLGSVTSAAATLTVLNAVPSITTQPASTTNSVGQTATFTVAATGLAPLSYQWKVQSSGSYVNLSNGGQYSGVTNTTLSISSLALTNATNYEVVVTNSAGSVTSSAATLTVSTNSSSYQSVVLGDGPLAFWPLNETTGTTIHDIAGTNNGTAINTNNLGYAGPGVTYTNNSSDRAMYFTNTGDPYISVPYNAAFQTTSFSVELWLNMPTFPANAQSANENPVGFCNGLSALGWTFDIQVANASNPHMYGWVGKSGSWNSGDSGVALQSQWSYYVMTFNGSTLKVYTNGVQAASTSVTTYSMVSSGNYLFIGDYNDGGNSPDTNRYYQGGIENVAVYSNALTVAQITNHYYFGTNSSSSSGSAPSITTQPASRTNYTTQTATFSVTASGTAPLSYQWKVDVNGSYVNLSNVGQFSGATSSTLSISSLVLTNATNYEVVVTNSLGSVTSAAATLTVLNAVPSITTQPASTTNNVGQTATFTVAAAGLAPLSYQWKVQSSGSYVNLSNGGQYSGVTNTTLSISSLALTNATNYEVVVTNSAGSVTSAAAKLTVQTNSTTYQSVILGDSPVSYWPLNETTGTTIHDVAGTNNGTAMNTNNLGYAGPGVTYAHNTSSKAMYFTNSGSAGYISVPYADSLNTANFTVEAWLNMPTSFSSGGDNQNPLSFDCSCPQGWTWQIINATSSPQIQGWMSQNNGFSWEQLNYGSGTNGTFLGTWAYYVMTWNGTVFNIYTNGVSAGSYTPSGCTYQPETAGNTGPLYMGAYDNYGADNFYMGGMSQVAVYSNALSSSQITNHYYYGTNYSSGGGAAFTSPVAPTFKPAIGATLTPSLVSASSAKQFQMQVSAVANKNYTLQICTDLNSGNWVSLYTTNSTTNTTFVLTDPNAATNKQRFYRVLIGP